MGSATMATIANLCALRFGFRLTVELSNETSSNSIQPLVICAVQDDPQHKRSPAEHERKWEQRVLCITDEIGQVHLKQQQLMMNNQKSLSHKPSTPKSKP